jgi:hypothetical protein
MPRIFRIIAIAAGALLVTTIMGWCVAFLLAGWLHSMMMNDPMRQLWQPRIDHAMYYFAQIVLVVWLLFVSLCWKFTHGFRGTQHI